MIDPHGTATALLIMNAIGFLTAIWFVADRRRRMHAHRIHDLELSRYALNDFYDRLEELLDRSDLPEQVRDYFAFLSEFIDEKVAATAFMDQMRLADPAAGRRRSFQEFFGIDRCSRDLIELASKANTAAAVSMLMRWPGTARGFHAMAAEFALGRCGDAPILKSSPVPDRSHGPLAPAHA